MSENPQNEKIPRRGLAKHMYTTFVQGMQEKNRILEAENKVDTVVTGLPNDKAFFEMLTGLQKRWERDSISGIYDSGSFIVMDLAGLHEVNDSYGKEAGGNDYLRMVAGAIKKVARGEDRYFRMGTQADEFVLYLPETVREKDLKVVMDRLDRELIENEENSQEKYPGIKFKLSYSASSFGKGVSPNSSYHDASNAMGEAKAAGKGMRAGDVGRLFKNTIENV